MELKIDGRLIFPEDMPMEDAICKLMKALSTENIRFVGSSRDITQDNIKIFSK